MKLEQLRRHAIARTLATPTTLARAVDRLGFLQADPIRAPARAQDLTLRHRVSGYRAGDLERRYPDLAIEEDFFVNYGFLPRATVDLMHPRSGLPRWPRKRAAQAEAVLEFVRERGVVHPREVDAEFAHGRTRNWFGGSSRASTQLLDAMHYEDIAACLRIGAHGAPLLPERGTVLTHCNAGALATGGYGTALGVIRAAVEAGKRVRVLADETRPYLQGLRLTAWELHRDGIPVEILTDGMTGWFFSKGAIDLAIVGSDRIARNGDVANKIGTYSVAVLARENGVPFYVAAPLSTIDLDCPDGDAIPIEERDPREVTEVFGVRIAPAGVAVRNPAFDVTPARYVSANRDRARHRASRRWRARSSCLVLRARTRA